MTDLGPIDRLVDRAATLAGAWGARARRSTTAGQERALLRLFGVHGLDRDGRPLAGEVVDGYVAGRPDRLASGVVLPFTVALLEYDVGPQDLALDVAAGTIDLGLEAELLEDDGRRTAAEAEAHRLTARAIARIDANRVARRELVDVLGDAPAPWLGAILADRDVDAARLAIGNLVRAGLDLIEVEVPIGRELATRLAAADVEYGGLDPGGLDAGSGIGPGGGGPGSGGTSTAEADEPDLPAPAGSQRGLAILRRMADEAAAERRRYVRLATVAPGLAAPEQAVVAAFERVDVAVVDAISEIVDGRVDPDRALADHAFALRLHRRAGSIVVVGPGPLVVGPDLATGRPSSATVRAGRALALQALGVAIARDAGLTPDQIVAGALPEWIAEETDRATLGIAQVALRRAMFPDLALGFGGQAGGRPERSAASAPGHWHALVAAGMPFGGRTAFVVDAERSADSRAALRELVSAAAAVGGAIDPGSLRGSALDEARTCVEAALRTLDDLADGGWRTILGEPLDGSAAALSRLGSDAVVERTGGFDPLA